MKRLSILIPGLVVAFQLGSISLIAQHGGGHGRGGPSGGFRGGPPGSVKHGRGDQDLHGGRQGHDNNARQRDVAHQNRLATRLAENPKLSSRLQGLLPPGTNVPEAATGFKNLGQFVAAAHVSRNLNIPFDQLKARMVGPDAQSLGKAIQDLRPDLPRDTVETDVKRAERQAKNDLKQLKKERKEHEAQVAGH